MSMVREYKGILIDDSRDALQSQMSKETLEDRYRVIKEDGTPETIQEIFARPAVYFADNKEHAQRLYDYISKMWFMPSTPVLSNGGTDRGFPISCFLNEVPDSLNGIWDVYRENMRLAAGGGGIGTYWSNVRGVGEPVGQSGETSGVMPFLKAMDAQTLAVSQGSLRRGSAAIYIRIDHSEVEEIINMRKPTGGDPNRKCLNLHHGVVITDEFMRAVARDDMWYYKSPKTGQIVTNRNGEPRCIKARELWLRLLDMRMEQGEPYLLFVDTVNEQIPLWHKLAGLLVKTSNLCIEIMLPTTTDRTAVCCLSSLNMAKFHEWQGNVQFIEDVHRFLDNVLSDFIKRARVLNPPKWHHKLWRDPLVKANVLKPDYKFPELQKAAYSAERERSIGLGLMGTHAFFQSIGIAFESEEARFWNLKVHKWIKEVVDATSKKLAEEKGPCPDAAEYGFMERNSNKMAIAPTASISIFADNTSPGIEPFPANAYTHKTKTGSFLVKNRYLEAILDKKGKNTDETWVSIINNSGSVQQFDFLNDAEKKVFKTAYEIDQNWIVTHAADRAPLVCQAASTNLFFPADVDKAVLHDVHWNAWAKGVKSLYYCRSLALKGAGNVSEAVERKRIDVGTKPVEIVGVAPMTGPTEEIFKLRAQYEAGTAEMKIEDVISQPVTVARGSKVETLPTGESVSELEKLIANAETDDKYAVCEACQ